MEPVPLRLGRGKRVAGAGGRDGSTEAPHTRNPITAALSTSRRGEPALPEPPPGTAMPLSRVPPLRILSPGGTGLDLPTRGSWPYPTPSRPPGLNFVIIMDNENKGKKHSLSNWYQLWKQAFEAGINGRGIGLRGSGNRHVIIYARLRKVSNLLAISFRWESASILLLFLRF